MYLSERQLLAIDRLNFWADVHVLLFLSTQSGIREWRGYLCFWFSAEEPGPLVGTIEEMTSENEAPDRGGLTLLSPYLIPYFTSAKMDDEAENIWRTYIQRRWKTRNCARLTRLPKRWDYPSSMCRFTSIRG